MASEMVFYWDGSGWVQTDKRRPGKMYAMRSFADGGGTYYQELSPEDEARRNADKQAHENKLSQETNSGAHFPDDRERLEVVEVQLGLRDAKTGQIKYFMEPGGLNGPVIKIRMK